MTVQYVTFVNLVRNGVEQIRKSFDGSIKIVSGGQTGVDRAALDEALAFHLEIGGWCPQGRRAEDGMIPPEYPLQETPARSYAVRTDWNVRDSDGTLILVLDEISTGTRLTIDAARAQGKPLHIVHLSADTTPGLLTDENLIEEYVESVVDWLRRHRIHVLNVAGPRGSSSERIYPEARAFLARLFLSLTGGTRKSAGLTVAAEEAVASKPKSGMTVRRQRKSGDRTK